ncbi:hypothetical protein [Bifidobacterium sp. ESL0764]|uniref:hypothetical protein n=1 Tax=Bifidobacterium sp. ESL0764 TaxID=2983228 RepID=UPI0023F7BC5A|nr:hypothetical protein [Bifidobacterium sp. ESL0764]WEV65435.1 hypothetical protein OZX71_06645 [Bifidobacterium sp. ESL0764]
MSGVNISSPVSRLAQHGVQKTATTVADAQPGEPAGTNTGSIWNMNSWSSLSEVMPVPHRGHRLRRLLCVGVIILVIAALISAICSSYDSVSDES